MNFGPVSSRTTIQDGVYQQLRQALMNGQFNPAQSLTIAGLAETFGTSNMPVREALRRLAAENALEIASNGSARVPVVTAARTRRPLPRPHCRRSSGDRTWSSPPDVRGSRCAEGHCFRTKGNRSPEKYLRAHHQEPAVPLYHLSGFRIGRSHPAHRNAVAAFRSLHAYAINACGAADKNRQNPNHPGDTWPLSRRFKTGILPAHAMNS